MNGPVIVGQRLKKIREQKGLSSKEVAAALGMNSSTYSHYEVGLRFPKLDTFYEICKYYDVDPNYLFGLSDMPHSFSKQPSELDREKALKSITEAFETAKDAVYKMYK